MDGFFLISSAVVTPSYQSHSHTSLPTFDTPASFKARRQALGLSMAQLGGLLGITGSNVEVIESIPLGEEVAFLHNLTLSLIELGGLEPLGA